MKVLVINPGATSTKIAVFEEDQQLFKLGLDHSAEELDQFDKVIDQADYRKGYSGCRRRGGLPAERFRRGLRPRRPVPPHPLRHLRRQ